MTNGFEHQKCTDHRMNGQVNNPMLHNVWQRKQNISSGEWISNNWGQCYRDIN